MNKDRKLIALFGVLLMILIGFSGAITIGQPTQILSAGSFNFGGSNPISSDLNISFARVSWTPDVPSQQWNVSNGWNHASLYGNGLNSSNLWAFNNSGYYSLINNASKPVVLSSPISMFNNSYLDVRAAFNFSSSSQGVDVIWLTNYTSASKFANDTGNATDMKYSYGIGMYSNLICRPFVKNGSAANLSMIHVVGRTYERFLHLYSFLLVSNTSTTSALIRNSNGSVLFGASQKDTILSAHPGMIKSIMFEQTGAGDLILDYGYLMNNQTILNSPSVQTAASISPFAIGPSGSSGSPSAGTNQNTSTLIASMSTNSLGSSTSPITSSESDFANVTSSNTTGSINSQVINQTLILNTSKTPPAIHADQFLATQRSQALPHLSVSSKLYDSTFSQAAIHAYIISFLKNYISAKVGIPASNITIISYTIAAMGFNIHLSSSAATQIRNQVLNSEAAVMSKDNISIVNTSTNAIEAGAFAGDFYEFAGGIGQAVHPVIQGSSIVSPSGKVFASLSAAGFPSGSYISSGAIIVPEDHLLGFEGAIPVYGGWFSSLTGSLTSGGAAVGSFLSQAGSTVTNSLTSLPSTASSLVAKPIGTIGKQFSNFQGDFSKSLASTYPLIGATLGKLSSTGSAISKDLGGAASSSLASLRSGTLGAIAAGAQDVRQGIYNIGNGSKNVILSTAHTAGNAANSVLSPVFTTIGMISSTASSAAYKTVNLLGGSMESINAAVHGAAANGIAALDTVGSTIEGAGTKIYQAANAFGNIAGQAVNDAGNIASNLAKDFNFAMSFATNLGKYIIYGVVIALGVVIVIAVFYLWRRSKSSPRAGKAIH
jgi:hypothetical protein